MTWVQDDLPGSDSGGRASPSDLILLSSTFPGVISFLHGADSGPFPNLVMGSHVALFWLPGCSSVCLSFPELFPTPS